jgi:hypothetical protein
MGTQAMEESASRGAADEHTARLIAEAAESVPASWAERLDYIADMIRELRILSAQANCRTLTGLLDLAYQEALERQRAG